MTEHDVEARRVHRRSSGTTAFVVAFLISFCAMALWSVATPLFAAPDEPVHVIKAAAVVRGQLLGKALPAPTLPAIEIVRVPEFYGSPTTENLPTCFHRKPTVPASCEPKPVGSAKMVGARIYNARYPPLYYAVVGLPSLLGEGTWALYLMRLVSALLSSVFIGLAVMSALHWSRNRVVLVGVLIAATPMAVFLGGVVNPSGLEVSAAICVWTAGSVLFLERRDDPPPGLVAVLAVSACVFELVRALSPFWLALTAVVLVAVSDLAGLRALVARRSVQAGFCAVAVLGGLAVAWILGEHAYDVYTRTPLPYSVPESTILETSFAHNDFYLQDMVGVFGWFDTFAPTFTYVAWYGLVGFVAIAAAAVGRLRHAVVLALFAVAIVVIPVAISSSQVHKYGYTWQGRDTLPFALGLPIVAAALIGTSALARRGGRLVGAVAVVAALGQFGAFYEALRRYAVGTDGPDFGFLLHPAWRPPLGPVPLVVGEAVLLALAGLLATLATRGRRPAVVEGSRDGPPRDPPPQGAGSGGEPAPGEAVAVPG